MLSFIHFAEETEAEGPPEIIESSASKYDKLVKCSTSDASATYSGASDKR